MSAPLKISRLLRKTIKISILRCKSSLAAEQTQQTTDTRTWQLHSGVILTRYPIITPDLTPFEQEYEKHLHRLEIDKSFLSDVEVEEKKLEKKLERKQKGLDADGTGESETELFKIVDLKEKWATEMKEFNAASRTNDPEIENDLTSLKRKMDRQLVLIVRQVFSEGETNWSFPQFRRQEGQSMREVEITKKFKSDMEYMATALNAVRIRTFNTFEKLIILISNIKAAEQALQLCSGGGIDATFIGNAPSGFGKYKLPEGQCDEYGVKVFYFKAVYNQGKVMDTEEIEDYKWVTHDELSDYLHPRWMKRMYKFLIEF